MDGCLLFLEDRRLSRKLGDDGQDINKAAYSNFSESVENLLLNVFLVLFVFTVPL